jgi:hypothetical protein
MVKTEINKILIFIINFGLSCWNYLYIMVSGYFGEIVS